MAITVTRRGGKVLVVGGKISTNPDCCCDSPTCCGPQGGCCFSWTSSVEITRIGIVDVSLPEPEAEALARYMAMDALLVLPFSRCEAGQPVWETSSAAWAEGAYYYRVRVEVRRTAGGWSHYVYIDRADDAGFTTDVIAEHSVLFGGNFSFPHPDGTGDCCGWAFADIPVPGDSSPDPPEGVYSLNVNFPGDITWADSTQAMAATVVDNECCNSAGTCIAGVANCTTGDCT
jgi:hypothetical protein